MAFSAEVIAQNKKGSGKEVTRPLAHFHPDIWGDRFLNYTPPPPDVQSQREKERDELKEEVRKKLLIVDKDVKQKLIFIDAVEQLGVAYHLEEEIESVLQQFYEKYGEDDDVFENDIHYVSLRFRLLRQHGFFVSCGVFEKFKNEDGCFKEPMGTDLEGILNLYEASYLRVHGEKILDEAVEFSTSQLEAWVDKLSPWLAKQVSQALKLPLHKGITRLLSRYYIDTYENNPSHDPTLLRFAKVDFNLLQSVHLVELRDLSKWWKNLEFGTKLPFVRDRIVEAYFWMLGTFYEPQYALGRAIFTKLFKMSSIMDDTYDAYGLFHELEAYTEAVQRWDKNCVDHLPDYMKLTYEKLMDTFKEFEQDLAEEGRSHLVAYVREMLKASCEAYFQEAKWLEEKYVPMYDEYLVDAAIRTAGYTLMSATTFLGMGPIATEEAFQWVSQTPKPVRASCIISRLVGDIASYKIERDRSHIASAVDCYMKQYGVCEEQAVEELRKNVEEAWKDLNQEMFRPTKFPRPLLMRILNLSRVIEVFYRLGVDDYSIVSQNMRDKIQAILIDPILL